MLGSCIYDVFSFSCSMFAVKLLHTGFLLVLLTAYDLCVGQFVVLVTVTVCNGGPQEICVEGGTVKKIEKTTKLAKCLKFLGSKWPPCALWFCV